MRDTLQHLNRMRESGVIGDYAIGGAMAATFYIEPVSTFDLDVFVALPQTPDKKIIKGVPVQFLPAYNPLVEEALGCAVETNYEGVEVPVFTAEHLVAIAVQTGRGKDKMRVQAFIDSGILNQTKLSDILRRYGLEAKWKQWTTIL